jgi:hypothetical protein
MLPRFIPFRYKEWFIKKILSRLFENPLICLIIMGACLVVILIKGMQAKNCRSKSSLLLKESISFNNNYNNVEE